MGENPVPIFVKIDEYKDVLELIGNLHEKLANARSTLNKIITLRDQEETEIKLWKAKLDGLQERLNSLDNEFLEPKI